MATTFRTFTASRQWGGVVTDRKEFTDGSSVAHVVNFWQGDPEDVSTVTIVADPDGNGIVIRAHSDGHAWQAFRGIADVI